MARMMRDAIRLWVEYTPIISRAPIFTANTKILFSKNSSDLSQNVLTGRKMSSITTPQMIMPKHRKGDWKSSLEVKE